MLENAQPRTDTLAHVLFGFGATSAVLAAIEWFHPGTLAPPYLLWAGASLMVISFVLLTVDDYRRARREIDRCP